MFDISRSTIGRLLNQEQDLREILVQKERMRQGKRQRSGKDPEVEETLNKWFKSVLDKGVGISCVIIRSKAAEFAVRLGKPGFVATEGWLSRWKARHQIKAKRIHGEKTSANFEGVEFWVSTVLPQLLQEHTPENIHNADETGLYYRATLDSSLCYTYEQISGPKGQWNVSQYSCALTCLVKTTETFNDQ
ncbi:Tigger transposable element-derived protein 4 [Oopsacas minuta]|uniref:Tigger transposable element-derived protein 4 n=1 Tax=Oopsacas minuta TaxID=111878 RepID=A0AAV7JC29_9METZ|nr:Tigger transposable element-derived protein 4 [Oopsacas minuta]